MLLENGSDPNLKDLDGDSSLTHASYGGRIEIVKLLIDHGADVNYTDFSGFAPIHYAILKGHSELLKLLISNGASLDVKILGGQSLLHCAVSKNIKEAAKILINSGAEVNERSFFMKHPSIVLSRQTTMIYAYYSFKKVHLSIQKILMERPHSMIQ